MENRIKGNNSRIERFHQETHSPTPDLLSTLFYLILCLCGLYGSHQKALLTNGLRWASANGEHEQRTEAKKWVNSGYLFLSLRSQEWLPPAGWIHKSRLKSCQASLSVLQQPSSLLSSGWGVGLTPMFTISWVVLSVPCVSLHSSNLLVNGLD